MRPLNGREVPPLLPTYTAPIPRLPLPVPGLDAVGLTFVELIKSENLPSLIVFLEKSAKPTTAAVATAATEGAAEAK